MTLWEAAKIRAGYMLDTGPGIDEWAVAMHYLWRAGFDVPTSSIESPYSHLNHDDKFYAEAQRTIDFALEKELEKDVIEMAVIGDLFRYKTKEFKPSTKGEKS